MTLQDDFDGVASRAQLRLIGIDSDQVMRQAKAGRWQVVGSAVVLHNGPPSRSERARALMINCGPRAVLTAFSALDEWGLRGWRRDAIHVLAPAGTRRPPFRDLVLHRVVDWGATEVAAGRRLHGPAPALVLAAGTLATPRPACGLLAAGVQQGLATAEQLHAELRVATRTRHRAAMLRAVGDIAQGAQALSEIDFFRLCRRAGLPPPRRQAVRVEPSGRRRYLDVEWRLPDGRIIAVEVDGALHIRSETWCADQLRQNEVVIGGTVVLRYPSVLVRHEPAVVIDQLTRAFAPTMMR